MTRTGIKDAPVFVQTSTHPVPAITSLTEQGKLTHEFDAASIFRVYRYVLANVSDEELAQDLTSETLLSAVEYRNNFRGSGSLSAWLLGIARHKIADYFRKRRETLSIDDFIDVPSPEPSTADLAEERWRLDEISAAMQTLTRDRADALGLSVFGQLNVNEIAQILGKRPSAVRMLIFRAIKDLRALLLKE